METRFQWEMRQGSSTKAQSRELLTGLHDTPKDWIPPCGRDDAWVLALGVIVTGFRVTQTF